MKRKKISRQLFNEDNFIRDKKRADGDENAVGSNGYGYVVEPERWREHWMRTEKHLDQTIANAKSLNIPVLVVFIPSNAIHPHHPLNVEEKNVAP